MIYKIIFVISLIFMLLLSSFFIGKSFSEKKCLKKEIEIKTETVEVIKYINKKDSEIYSRPSSSFEQLLQRMEQNKL